MKKQIRDCMIAGIFGLISFSSSAQDEHSKTPAWVSDRGYWIVESNINNPLQHTIRFYTNQHVLVGRKDMGGIKLDTRKRKVKMMLKDALENSLLAWEKNKSSDNKNELVQSKP